METPTWLAPPAALVEQSPQQKSAGKELTLNDIVFTPIFDDALERVVLGHPLTNIVRDNPRDIEYSKFIQWMYKDPVRKARYFEAREIGAEVVADQLSDIADAADNPLEDVARSTLRINARKFLLGVWNRKRYGDDRNAAGTTVGAGGITINFGAVTSPYAITHPSDIIDV